MGRTGKTKEESTAGYQLVRHEFEPVYDKNSRILILESFPSVKSREQQFYYGHPQNRFWKVLAGVLEVAVPKTIDEKKEMLLNNRIAIWDVIAECEIIGSSDSSIRNVIPTNLQQVLDTAPIEQIYVNGNTAKKLYDKFQKKSFGRECVGLPSTSPANAAFSLDRLIDNWKCIVEK